MHRGIIRTRCFVDVHVKTSSFTVNIRGLRLHLQGSLDTCHGENGNRGIAPVDSLLHTTTDLREFGFLCFLLLRVIVARQPPGGMVASHRKLRTFVLDEEIVQVRLLRELITESDAVVVNTETDEYLTTVLTGLQLHAGSIFRGGRAPLLQQSRNIFDIVVADDLGFTPNGLPRLVEGGGLLLNEGEAVHQVAFVHTHGGMLVLGQLKSQMRRAYHVLSLIR